MTKYKEEEIPQVAPKGMTPENVRRANLNPYPESDNEIQAMMIAPQAGRAQIGRDLDNIYKIKHPDSRVGSAWDYFTAQTSDTRLSNLRKENEIAYVRWSLRQQGRCLVMGLSKASANADWLRSTVCEPGLARNGFLRENIQSVHTKSESINVENVEKGRSMFGFLKNNDNR